MTEKKQKQVLQKSIQKKDNQIKLLRLILREIQKLQEKKSNQQKNQELKNLDQEIARAD